MYIVFLSTCIMRFSLIMIFTFAVFKGGVSVVTIRVLRW